MSTIKYTGGDLMQPRHIFKHLKRGKSAVVATLPASLAGEEILKSMKEQPVILDAEIIEEVSAKPVKSKKKDDNDGDSTEE